MSEREYERERGIAAQWNELYCIWRGVFIGGGPPPRAGWRRQQLGEANSPLGLVETAARGRQQLGKAAPPPTLTLMC
jgi:hypothetical protein